MASWSYLFTDVRGFLLQLNRRSDAQSPQECPPVALSGALIPGWQGEQDSDLLLVPDMSWAARGPFTEADSRLIFAQPAAPGKEGDYSRDPRAVAKRCEAYLKSTGIADTAKIGPELEFHLLKGIRFRTDASKNFVELAELDGWPNNAAECNSGYRVGHNSMHFHAPPNDQFLKLRERVCAEYEQLGIRCIHHGHEAGPSQQEIGVEPKNLLRAADEVQLQKHVIKNVA